ncbi:unnamed protein product [Oppiella nova]|uniref:TRUD domain-containing protein n=1 Tax=Oppiella nova TaxID=334625 RepID=A0A7R9QEQ0_9ACAR|nr:unnamed protein product [Oppiella nova]CAG2163534.1 unnamed protein product [Oppiella nova]
MHRTVGRVIRVCIQRIFAIKTMETSPKRIKLDATAIGEPIPSASGGVGDDEDNKWRSLLDRRFDEKDVGISEFIGHFKPFTAVLKNRYEDFLVHEISRDRRVVRLLDTSRPVEDVIPVLDIHEVLDDSTVEQIRQLAKPCDDNEVEMDSTIEFLDSQPTVEESVTESTDTTGVNVKSSEVKIPVTGLSKHARTRIHKAIRDNYESLETSTIGDTEADKHIVVKRVDSRSHDSNGRRRHAWPQDKGEYIHFVLYKENRETQQALQELALKMHISAKNFSTAGTKDKRAITAQEVSAYKVPPRKIWEASQRCRDVEVGHFRFERREIKLGDLKGNRFDIVLRDVPKSVDMDAVAKSMESVRTTGAINYYGMQRFGFQYEKPYAIGIAILRQQWERVVELILSDRPQDIQWRDGSGMSFNECLNLWRKTRDAKSAFNNCPQKWTPEATLLKGLSRVADNDYMGALCTGMHRNQRLLYLHCYQSYVWNRTASYRVRTYGQRVVAGDLLLKSDNEVDSEVVDSNGDKKGSRFGDNIVVADERNSSGASIYDIVLPVIGSDNVWPTNSVGDYMRELLGEDEVSVDMFKALPKQWCVFGTYRRLYVKPEDFEYEWCDYKDPNVPLIDSDLVTIRRKAQEVDNCGDNKTKDVECRSAGDDSVVNSDDKLALKISMSLPTSTYATMICRQITRTETTILETKPWLKSRFNV